MIKPEDFTGTNYIEILGIKEKGNKISIKYKERYNATTKTVNIVFDETGTYTLQRGEKVMLQATRENIVEEINKLHFSYFIAINEAIKTDKARERRKANGKAVRDLYKDKLKPGDIVERRGKTPNLGLYLIEVTETSNYGVSGFYIYPNKKRSHEYTTVSWDYIIGEVK